MKKKFIELLESELHGLEDMEIILKEGEKEATELNQYLDNDGGLYRSDVVPAVKIMKKKLERDEFSQTANIRVWIRIAEKAAMKYAKEYGTPGDSWQRIFSRADIQQVATEFMEYYLSEWKHNQLSGF